MTGALAKAGNTRSTGDAKWLSVVEIAEPDSAQSSGGVRPPRVVLHTNTSNQHAGAEAVMGPFFRQQSSDLASVEVGQEEEESRLDSNNPPIVATAVDPDEEEARIQAIRLDAVSEAMKETVKADNVILLRSKTWLWLAIILLVSIAIVLSVTLTRTGDDNDSDSSEDGDIIASLKFNGYSTESIMNIEANIETRLIKNSDIVTSGYISEFSCLPLPCTDGKTCLNLTKEYVPGCCPGTAEYCEEGTLCGDQCPHEPGKACYKIDPEATDCISAHCYKCHNGPDGNPLWDITEIIYQVDCLDVSKMTDAKTGEDYLGAIACGRIVSEPGFPERNFDVGEYGCMAFQERTTSPEQMQSSFIGPCQYFQLGECQWAPADVFPWGLDPPTGPCRTEEDCPFLCADAGAAKAKNLCHAFGGVDWWSTRNFLGIDLFKSQQQTNLLEIYDASA